MNDKTYPLGVWEMFDEVKNLEKMEIINECFKKWWKYNEIRDLQQRIDKAIEYINSFEEENPDFNSDFYKDDNRKTWYGFEDIVENTTKILRGDSDE